MRFEDLRSGSDCPRESLLIISVTFCSEPYFRRVAGASPQLVWCQGSVLNRGTRVVPRRIWGGRLGSSCHLPVLASSKMFIILPNACTSIHIGSCRGFPALAWGALVPVSAGSWLKAQESLGGFPSTGCCCLSESSVSTLHRAYPHSKHRSGQTEKIHALLCS